MPALDFASLSLLTFVSLGLMAIALPLAMGRNAISLGAQHAQRYFLLQALAWCAILIASRHRETWADLVFASAATWCVAGAQWQIAQALQHWLGQRSVMPWLRITCSLAPLGFLALWQSPTARFVWFTTLQGVGLLLIAHMCLRPVHESERGWRLVLCGCAVTIGLALLMRAVFAFFNPSYLPSFTAQNWINQSFVVLAHVATTLTLVAVLVAWRDESHRQLQKLAQTDMLTGIPNRRAFTAQAEKMLNQARRLDTPLALVLIDLDHFKRINDDHGHAKGDQVLCLFAQTLQQEMRSGDLLARWGGEEFCLLVHASTPDVLALYERLHLAVTHRSTHELGWQVRFSAGWAIPSAQHSTLDQLMLRADAALYKAKAAGRACMVFASDEENFSNSGDAALRPVHFSENPSVLLSDTTPSKL